MTCTPHPGMLVAIAAGAMLTAARAEDMPAHSVADPVAQPVAADKSTELDLRAPTLSELYTPEEIQAMVARTQAEDEKSVVVEGTREPPPHVTPDIWMGIATPFWALFHPTQAWRVFLPLPPDQTKGLDAKPYDTDTDGVPVEAPFR